MGFAAASSIGGAALGVPLNVATGGPATRAHVRRPSGVRTASLLELDRGNGILSPLPRLLR